MPSLAEAQVGKLAFHCIFPRRRLVRHTTRRLGRVISSVHRKDPVILEVIGLVIAGGENPRCS